MNEIWVLGALLCVAAPLFHIGALGIGEREFSEAQVQSLKLLILRDGAAISGVGGMGLMFLSPYVGAVLFAFSALSLMGWAWTKKST